MPSPRAKKPPKKPSERRLENAAQHYLGRFPATRARLREVLLRRVDRALAHHGGEREEWEPVVDAVVARMVEAGLVDDDAYARLLTDSLFNRGKAPRIIRQKLREKGVQEPERERALARLHNDHDDAELSAAIALVRKKRLGPLRDEGVRKERYQKDLAALARAGFGYGTAKKVLETDDLDTLEAR